MMPAVWRSDLVRLLLLGPSFNHTCSFNATARLGHVLHRATGDSQAASVLTGVGRAAPNAACRAASPTSSSGADVYVGKRCSLVDT